MPDSELRPSAAHTILSVDDLDSNRYVRARALRAAGFSVIEAANGRDALTLAALEQPSLVLLDVRLPDIDGFEVCRRLKSDPKTASIPVINISALGRYEEDVPQAVEHQSDLYLREPVDQQTIVATVTALIRAKEAEQRQEAALRESEQRFRSLLENSLDAVLLARADGRIEAANPAACALFRMTEQEIRERGRAGLTDESDPKFQKALEERHRTGRARGEFTYIRKDGTRFLGEMSSVLVGKGIAFVNVRDVTDRRRVEQALRDSERHFRELADSMPEVVWIADAAGEIVYFNRRASEMGGVGPNQLSGERWAELLHPEDRERCLSYWRRCLETGEMYEIEVRFHVASGEYRWSLNRAVPFRDELGRITRWYGTCIDIEDRKRAEERLRHSQKMETVGLLAGGIAHDFNNILVSIMGNAALAEDMLPPDHPVSDLVGRIVEASDYAARLINQLLAYSGQGRFVIEPVNISEVVRELRGLLQPSISTLVKVNLELERDLPPVAADRTQMQQIVTNLVLNASEAIGDHPGTISIQTGVEELDESRKRADPDYADLTPGRFVYLEVRDTGPGMDEATKARLFDPFFTTKFTGRGLGLAAVAGIVRGHGGAIKVTTAVGKGACFRVLLPVESRAE